MVPVARKNLLADKVRLLIAIGGVTFAVLLILVVQSLYQGFSVRIGSFSERAPADLWVGEADTAGFVYASRIPVERGTAIAAVPGVRGVVPLYAKRLTVRSAGGTNDTYFIAFDVTPAVARALGLALPRPGEVIIDRVFARDAGLGVEDSLRVRDRDLTVVGIGDLSGAGLTQFSLMAGEDARELLATPGFVSYFLVGVVPGVAPAAVEAAIDATVPGVDALTKAEFSAANRREVSGTFLPIVGVLLVVAFLVGVAVVGITIYTATIERTREYGVLKAIGASTGQLLRIVFVQSLVVGVTGFVLGVPLALGVNWVAGRFVPEFVTLIRGRDVAAVFAASVLMALVSGFVPIRRVAGIDPAEVFRA